MSATLGELIQNDSSYLQELKSAVKQEMHCAMPGIVRDYDPETQTVSVQPAIRDRRLGLSYEDMPLLLDVPVYFPGGGSVAVCYPIHPGDECLVIFSDACMDAWFHSGGAQNPVVPRRHDLSDGFALVGFRSVPNALPPLAANRAFSVRVKKDDAWQEPFAVTTDGEVLMHGEEVFPVHVDGEVLVHGNQIGG